MTQRDWDDPAYKRFRNSVLLRDKFTCQFPNCNRKSKSNHVHHIIPHSYAYSLRFEKFNGICLCAKHHKEITDFEYVWASYFSLRAEENEKKQKRRKRKK